MTKESKAQRVSQASSEGVKKVCAPIPSLPPSSQTRFILKVCDPYCHFLAVFF